MSWQTGLLIILLRVRQILVIVKNLSYRGGRRQMRQQTLVLHRSVKNNSSRDTQSGNTPFDWQQAAHHCDGRQPTTAVEGSPPLWWQAAHHCGGRQPTTGGRPHTTAVAKCLSTCCQFDDSKSVSDHMFACHRWQAAHHCGGGSSPPGWWSACHHGGGRLATAVVGGLSPVVGRRACHCSGGQPATSHMVYSRFACHD